MQGDSRLNPLRMVAAVLAAIVIATLECAQKVARTKGVYLNDLERLEHIFSS